MACRPARCGGNRSECDCTPTPGPPRKDLLDRLARLGGRVAVLVLVTLLAGPATRAQDLPLLGARPVPVQAAASAFDPAQELAAVQTQLTRLQPGATGATPAPLLDEQRNLASRLALLLTLEARPAETVAPLPEPPAPVTGSPPYPTAELDVLRDAREDLAIQVDSLALRLRNLDSQINARVAALRKSEEAVRLKADLLARENDEDKRQRLQAEAEVARLQARVQALELKRADREREVARNRLAALKTQADGLDQDIARVRPAQRITDEDLERIARSAQLARQQLDGQRREIEAQLAQREPATEGVGRVAEAAQREAQALRERSALLNELDMLETGREEAWRQRRTALDATDPAARAEAALLLQRSIAQLQSRLRSGGTQAVQARSVLRLQRLRVEGLAGDAPEAGAERTALQAQQALVETHEIAQEALGHIDRLLARTLADVSATARAERPPWHQELTRRLVEQGQALWHYELFSVSDTTRVDGRSVTVDYGVTVGKSIGVLVLFFVGWALAWGLSRLTIGWLVRRLRLSDALGRVMQRWVLTLLVLAVLVVVLKVARIPLTVFAFLGGALAIGVGFGTQNIIKNLISGVIILLERKIRVGDIVTIDSVSGTVTAVDLRATTVRGFDGINAIVPNSLLLENRVSNWSIGSPTVRRSLLVGLSYGQDARRACDVLLACARAHTDVLALPEPEVLYDDFGADAQSLRLQFWVRLGGPLAGPTVDSDLRHAIAEAFAAAGFGIPFPQRDVHLDLKQPLQIRQDRPGRARRWRAR